MEEVISFKGFKNYPKGNANIALSNNSLVLSDMSTTRDGLVVETNGVPSFEITFRPHTVKSGEVFGSTFNIIDGLKRIKTIGQWALTENADGEYAYLVVNSRLEGGNIQVIGKKNGEIVYTKNITNTQNVNEPYNNFIVILAVAVIAVTYVVVKSTCKKEKHVKKDKDGNTTEVEEKITKSIGLNCKIAPIVESVATINPTLENTLIEIDEVIISSSRTYPGEIPSELDGEIAEVIFNTNAFEDMIIVDEKIVG